MAREAGPILSLETGGILVRLTQPDTATAGDLLDAYAGDMLLGTAPLAAERGRRLAAAIPLQNLPDVLPATVRVMNRRTAEEYGKGILVSDMESLAAAVGETSVTARLDTLDDTHVAFRVNVSPLPTLPRRFILRRDERAIAEAIASAAPDAQTVRFALPERLPLGAAVELVTIGGAIAFQGTIDTQQALAAVLSHAARLQASLDALRLAHDALHRRLDTALDLGRERLLLDRLDLFYLLLAERIDREARAQRSDMQTPVASVAEPHRFEPADIEGTGIYEVETDGATEWRWFGPRATIALRGVAAGARRAVLYFHSFGDAIEPPGIRISAGGAAEPVALRILPHGFAVDLPLYRARAWPDDMLILHVAFDRHQTSASDPRPLSAVFTGAEIFTDR